MPLGSARRRQCLTISSEGKALGCLHAGGLACHQAFWKNMRTSVAVEPVVTRLVVFHVPDRVRGSHPSAVTTPPALVWSPHNPLDECFKCDPTLGTLHFPGCLLLVASQWVSTVTADASKSCDN